MINLSTSVEQKNRERQEADVVLSESELNTDLYSEGYFLGYIGAEPTRPEDPSYWSGYRCPTGIRLATRGESATPIGSREYWANKLGVEIPS